MGWHAPAGRRTCDPRPLAQDGQIRPAAPVGGWNLGPDRQIVSQDSTKRRQPNRRSDRDPVPQTLAPTASSVGSGVRGTTHTLPAEYGFNCRPSACVHDRAHIHLFCSTLTGLMALRSVVAVSALLLRVQFEPVLADVAVEVDRELRHRLQPSKVRVPLEYPKRKLAVSLVHPAFRSHGSHHVRKRRLSMMLAKDQELIVIHAYPRLLLLHVSDGFRFLLGIFVELLPVLGIASRLVGGHFLYRPFAPSCIRFRVELPVLSDVDFPLD